MAKLAWHGVRVGYGMAKREDLDLLHPASSSLVFIKKKKKQKTKTKKNDNQKTSRKIEIFS